jgi:hypothetical protein
VFDLLAVVPFILQCAMSFVAHDVATSREALNAIQAEGALRTSPCLTLNLTFLLRGYV